MDSEMLFVTDFVIYLFWDVSAISLSWFADFGKTYIIIQWQSQPVPSYKW